MNDTNIFLFIKILRWNLIKYKISAGLKMNSSDFNNLKDFIMKL